MCNLSSSCLQLLLATFAGNFLLATFAVLQCCSSYSVVIKTMQSQKKLKLTGD